METDISNITIEKTKQSRIGEVNFNQISFGKVFTDHMLVADYQDGQWKNPLIMPYGDLTFKPSMTALHYGQAIFEGLEAYKNSDNKEIYIFRPYENFKRFNISAQRICMPEISEEIFIGGMQKLISVDKDWLTNKNSFSLYIRPLMFATDTALGLKCSSNYKFVILLSLKGKNYYDKPVKVKIETDYTRAACGGVGFTKTAGNYAASLYPAKMAQKKGYDQLVWTDAKEHQYIEEAGTMNIFFFINNTLITAPTSDTILKGITRDSVIQLAKEWKIQVEERMISIPELIDAIQKKTLKEAFGTGTAVTIIQIALIHYKDEDYILPNSEKTFSKKIFDHLYKIKYGKIPDPYNWLYKI